MIVMTVRTNDLRKEKAIKEGAFENAWFRLQNEDTNQSLDYINIKTVDLPEGYVEEGPVEVEEEEGAVEPEDRNELTYICGRVWLNQEPKTMAEKVVKMKQERSQASIAPAEGDEDNVDGSVSGHNRSRASPSGLANPADEE